MKSGFVSIFGKPNAGKSTLLNAVMGEKLAIVSHKVQTTRQRIKGILTGDGYQLIFSDTPGIIIPEYRLHEKMMESVRNSVLDADVALLMMDGRDRKEDIDHMFESMGLKVPGILVINKIDKIPREIIEELTNFFREKKYCREVVCISALKKINLPQLLERVIHFLPEGEPFFDGDEMTDRPVKFFAGELIREKIFQLYNEEIPYHTAVIIQEYKEKTTLTKIQADIVVQRETQKGILLGEGGKMIKLLGMEARKDIEEFIGRKIFLELFVKVRPKWRDSELHLKEYGY